MGSRTRAILLDFTEASNAEIESLKCLLVVGERLDLKEVNRRSNVQRIRKGQDAEAGAEIPHEEVEDGDDGCRRRDTMYEIAMNRRWLIFGHVTSASQHWAVQENLERVVQAAREW